MSVALYPLLSGDSFFVGLGLVIAGASSAPWRPRLGRTLAGAGCSLAVLSAVPVPTGAYVGLLASVVVWYVTQGRAVWARRTATALLFVVAAALAAAELYERRPPSLDVGLGRPVVVIGDSLSAGVGPPGEQTWPVLVSQRQEFPVANLAQATRLTAFTSPRKGTPGSRGR